MPKTKDAFALRDIIEESHDKNFSTVFDKLLGGDLIDVLCIDEDEDGGSPEDFELALIILGNFEKRCEVLSKIVANHISRLQIYSEKIFNILVADQFNKEAKLKGERVQSLLVSYREIHKQLKIYIPKKQQFARKEWEQFILNFKRGFGDRLKQARQKHNIKMDDVAKALNMTRVGYSYYENGTREPPLATIRLLAEIFGVSTDWLFGLKK